jgi:hypothetical protein
MSEDVKSPVQNTFPNWLMTNTGEISLLNMYSMEEPFPANFRLLAEIKGGVSLIGRICESGPEGRLVSLRDWIGGYKISFIGHTGQITSMAPIHSEKATLAVLRAFASDLARQGYPAPLTAFMPGGSKYEREFNPLLPVTTKMGKDAPQKFVIAALENPNLVRVAPPAGMPDTQFEGVAVYDQRMPSSILSNLLVDIETKPVMVMVPTIGGPPHWLLADGVLGDITQTWMIGGFGEPVGDMWPRAVFRCEYAPDFIPQKTRQNRLNLN